MQKLKTERMKPSQRLSTKVRVTTIRCGANLLPVKGLIYALLHAKANEHIKRTKDPRARAGIQRLSRHIGELNKMSDDLQHMKDVDPMILYRSIKLAIAAYVNLFYNLTENERNNYLERCDGHTLKRIDREQNLLLLPAIMAERGEPKPSVAAFLVNNIYRIPFRVLYHASKASMHIELLEQAMGIKSAPAGLMKQFSDTLHEICDRMEDISDGVVDPQADEELKQRFIEEAVKLSDTADMRIADFITEKIMPNAFSEKVARKMVRNLA